MPDPRSIVLSQRPGHAMHQPDAETLAAIVEEAGNQELLVGHAAGPKRRYDIEAVSTICRRHVIEYRKLRFGRKPTLLTAAMLCMILKNNIVAVDRRLRRWRNDGRRRCALR